MSLQSWKVGLRGSALSLTIALLTSCTPQPPTTAGSPTGPRTKIVASYSVLCGLTQEIAEDTIDLKCLIPGGKDPHTYSPTPDDRKALETAQLVLYGGYEFEPEVIKLVKASSSKNAIAVHELAVPKPIKNPEADPHVWHNVKNGIAIVQVLKIQLSQANPANTARYEKNAKDLTDRLTQLDTWITQSIATIPPASRKLVTTHDALTYYGKAYGIPIEGALQGLSTDEKPSAQRIKTLVDRIKSTQVPTLFAELSVNPKLLETVAKEAKVNLSKTPLVADGLGAPGSSSDTYEKMMRENTNAIVTGLGGKI
jgi:manganese/iron transport system substrate-binding protein